MKKSPSQIKRNAQRRAKRISNQTNERHSHLQVVDAEKHQRFLREHSLREIDEKLSQFINRVNQKPKLTQKERNKKILEAVKKAEQTKNQIRQTKNQLPDPTHTKKEVIQQIRQTEWLTKQDKAHIERQTRKHGHTYTQQHIQQLKKLRKKINFKKRIPLETMNIIAQHILPKIPKKYLWQFFSCALPKTLQHNPTPQTWNTILQIMPKIPQHELCNFFDYALPKTLKHKPTPQTLRIIGKHILPKIPQEKLNNFFAHALPASLKHKPTPTQLLKTWNTIIHKIMPKIPKEQLGEFFWISLSITLKHNPNPKKLSLIWNSIIEFILPKIPKQSQFDFFSLVLPKILETNPSPKQLKELNMGEGFVSLYKNASYDFFDIKHLKPGKIKREKMEKSGPPTTLLGGKLMGKAIIRTIPETAFEAWEKAEQSGIPVEPILKKTIIDKKTGEIKETKDRAYSTKKGEVRVSTKVMKGQQLFDIVSHLSPAQRTQIYNQIIKIMKSLWSNNIVHGHPHLRNFLVEWTEKKGKKYPKVYLIDFDNAEIVFTGGMERAINYGQRCESEDKQILNDTLCAVLGVKKEDITASIKISGELDDLAGKIAKEDFERLKLEFSKE